MREAEFFLSKLNESERSTRLGGEDFDHYLSAFLSAFRSITWVWQTEDRASYDARAKPWAENGSEAAQSLMKFLNDQRVGVVHKEGTPELERQLEYVDALSASNPGRPGGSGPPIGWLLTLGDEGATMGVGRHYFKKDDQLVAVVDVCAEGIRLMKDFMQ